MKHLTDKHLIRLSNLLNIPLETLTEMDSMGMLSYSGILSYIIRKDWKTLANKKEGYTFEQIAMALSNEYNVTTSFVYTAVRSKKKVPYYCKECGNEIGYAEYKKNSGLCDHCVIKSIKIEV